jgi:hypothetical protein
VAALEGDLLYERFGSHCAFRAPHAHLAWCHAELGRFTAGYAFGDEGLRIAEAVAHPASLIYASWGSGLPFLR